MKSIIVLMTTIICGWLGWWLGNHFNFWTAFILSTIGSGVGIYAGRQFIKMF
ncbi:MAG: hypothetical protein GY865_08965 [candidate division Zixibacteria bacterium]|nr:hypothetical protein [candidate division Zixibacteria bacterium]